jgi:hypothetical protein
MLTVVQLIKVILSISGWCLGWRVITSEGMLFGFLRRWAIDHLNPFLAKPLILCITCMSSIWGSIIFWLFFAYSDKDVEIITIFEWIFCCCISSFISTFAWQLNELIGKQRTR